MEQNENPVELWIQLELSKSQVNRALILRSFAPHLRWSGESSCDDVRYLQTALNEFTSALNKSEKSKTFYCGMGGTTFRFLALRLSREPGVWELKMEPELFARPQEEIEIILAQLGVSVRRLENRFQILSSGWKQPRGPLKIPGARSSQFASAVLLSCWGLDFPLHLQIESALVSSRYWEMTFDLFRKVGGGFELGFEQERSLLIPAFQKVNPAQLSLEVDASSAWAIVAVHLGLEEIRIRNFFPQSQPDACFTEFLSSLGYAVRRDDHDLLIPRFGLPPQDLNPKGANFDVIESPDLFPSLAILLAITPGNWNLKIGPQLVFKESNRLQEVLKILRALKVDFSLESSPDKNNWINLRLRGRRFSRDQKESFEFDPSGDHRMAFAVSILCKNGWQINILNRDVVLKSYPNFWKDAGL